MAKVTSKLQVTVPKALATQYRIRPGDDILWVASGDSIRVVPARPLKAEESVTARLKLFDRATGRLQQRSGRRSETSRRRAPERGWTREDLYDRGRTR